MTLNLPKISSFLSILLLAGWLASPARGAQSAGAAGQSAPEGRPRVSQEIQFFGDQNWVDTGFDVQAGERVIFTSTGTLRYPDAGRENGPAGLPRGWGDLVRSLPLNDEGRGAVIGRVGDASVAQPFLIGASRDVTIRMGGRLALGINQTSKDRAEGAYRVRIEIFPAAPGAAPSNFASLRDVPAIPGVDAALFAKVPRRNGDKDGNPGDMINFLILGSEQTVVRAFELAGWVKVDRSPRDAVVHGLVASLSRESYVQMPMSELYLFGRFQDYGFAHAEPLRVVTTRHHLRLWKAPFSVNGREVWVGAATHDIGLERDKRNNGVTHKIDPNIDEERDYVSQTLGATGLFALRSYFLPPSPLLQAKTATGGSFHSNGKVLILQSAEASRNLSAQFTDMFCGVMNKEHPDGSDFAACNIYLEDKPSGTAKAPGPLASNYRILVIPGVLSSCQNNVQAFQQGQEHLRKIHGLTVDFLQMPNDSSMANAERIAAYLREALRSDPRKFIVVTYSKGAPDFMEALPYNPDVRSAVAAYVTIAGAVGGTPTAETMPAMAQRYVDALHLGSCQGNLTEAFWSLRSDVRKAFLADHPDLGVPAFSLSAVSEPGNTSEMLRENWNVMASYDKRNDSQLLQSDTLVPGGYYLGVARTDHLAVALGYEYSPDGYIRGALDYNHFPRVALFEAVVRVVIETLQAAVPPRP
jgi:hypothetical protein